MKRYKRCERTGGPHLRRVLCTRSNDRKNAVRTEEQQPRCPDRRERGLVEHQAKGEDERGRRMCHRPRHRPEKLPAAIRRVTTEEAEKVQEAHGLGNRSIGDHEDVAKCAPRKRTRQPKRIEQTHLVRCARSETQCDGEDKQDSSKEPRHEPRRTTPTSRLHDVHERGHARCARDGHASTKGSYTAGGCNIRTTSEHESTNLEAHETPTHKGETQGPGNIAQQSGERGEEAIEESGEESLSEESEDNGGGVGEEKKKRLYWREVEKRIERKVIDTLEKAHAAKHAEYEERVKEVGVIVEPTSSEGEEEGEAAERRRLREAEGRRNTDGRAAGTEGAALQGIPRVQAKHRGRRASDPGGKEEIRGTAGAEAAGKAGRQATQNTVEGGGEEKGEESAGSEGGKEKPGIKEARSVGRRREGGRG
eukprot:6195253-Pleurochrysis_carterae.AAC.6